MPNIISRVFIPFKVFSMVVLALMVLAVGYALVISFNNWGSISV